MLIRMMKRVEVMRMMMIRLEVTRMVTSRLEVMMMVTRRLEVMRMVRRRVKVARIVMMIMTSRVEVTRKQSIIKFKSLSGTPRESETLVLPKSPVGDGADGMDGIM
jgi:hypothetical protein